MPKDKHVRWISHDPTQEELLAQFAPAIQREVSMYHRNFSLAKEDVEDMRHDIIVKMLAIPSPKQQGVCYVLQSIHNAAASSICRLTGKRPDDKQSKSQRTLYFEEQRNENDGFYPLIENAITILPDPLLHLMLMRVNEKLSGPALEIYNWVLADGHGCGVRGLSRYCKKTLGLTVREVSTARLQIVDAMHECGLALDFPPPKSCREQKRPRLTPVERLHWLMDLREAGYQTAIDAARAAGTNAFVLNYHVSHTFGCNYEDWVHGGDYGRL